MGLTKRKDGWYVEFPVLDDGKALTLARGVPGARVKRWKTSTLNLTLAKQQEALIKTDLMKGIVKSARAQGPMAFKALSDAYLADPKIQRQAIYERKESWIRNRFQPAFGERIAIDAITPTMIENYLESRRADVETATVNRELACIKHIFSWAIKKGILDKSPARHLRQEKEDNVRDEILEPAQFEALQAHSPAYLQPINLVAYQTGMRRGEILGLTWDKVDLKAGFIRLRADDTKTKQARSIPLTPELAAMLRDLQKTRALYDPRVFLRDGQPIRSFREDFEKARRLAKIEAFRFHDLRHTAITNMRRAGIDHLTIMRITGHRTMVCFTRYNSFREPDLSAAARQFNTYLTLAHETASAGTHGEQPQAAVSC